MHYDFIAFMISSVLVLSYYFVLIFRIRKSGYQNIQTVNRQMRAQWLAIVIHNDKMDILAIQTLRNSVMAANFMASTAVLLIIGTLNLSDKIKLWALHWHPFISVQAEHQNLWQLKLGLLVLIFFISFYCFSMAIRFFNHVGYMITLARETTDDEKMLKQTCTYLNRAGDYYSYGTRSFFFSLPIISWFFGAYFLVLATVGLIFGLIMMDKAPSP